MAGGFIPHEKCHRPRPRSLRQAGSFYMTLDELGAFHILKVMIRGKRQSKCVCIVQWYQEVLVQRIKMLLMQEETLKAIKVMEDCCKIIGGIKE